MKKLIVFISVVAMICFSSRVSYSTQYWAKTYGGSENETAYPIKQTSDGGYIVAGETNSFGAGNRDFLLLKLDSSGNITWQKTYGGTNIDGMYNKHQPYSIHQTKDDGYIMVGLTMSFGSGSYDILVLKLDSNGDVDWQKAYGGSASDWACKILPTSDGGYIVAGGTYTFGAGTSARYLLKLDSSGGIMWEKTYGGMGQDGAMSVQQTLDGGYVVAGHASSFGAGDFDFWILKLENDGDVLWEKTYGGINWDKALAIQATLDGGFIVLGNTLSFGAGSHDIWILKLDTNGEISWQKTYGGSASDEAYAILEAQDGGYIAVGYTESFGAGGSDLWMLKLNNDGTINWQKTYGDVSQERAFSIQQISEGYMVSGETMSYGAGNYDFLVLKIDDTGYIPDCSLIGTSDAIVTDTSVVGQNTNATVQSSSAIITNTSITPPDSSATMTLICEGELLDYDGDGIPNHIDNCINTANGPTLGTCLHGNIGETCTINEECDVEGGDGFCSMNQEDNYPPNGNGIGDVCECEGDFDCDGDVDGSDASLFKLDFGRSAFSNPCPACGVEE